MKLDEVKKYAGKHVLIVLKNTFRYDTVLPPEIDTSFSIVDKYGKDISIDCDMIGLIIEGGGK